MVLLRICGGCGRKLRRRQRCSVCRGRREAQRGTAAQRGYGSRWQRYRRGWLARHPLCGDREGGPSGEHSACRAEGRPVPAEVVDHIQPHKGDAVLFWRRDNHQSLCKACHDSKTAREQRQGDATTERGP